MARTKQNHKTSFPKTADVTRDWYVIDATDKTLGRLCCEIARILQGKRKATFSPHCNVGDYVIITNAGKITYTGKNKGQQSKLWRHSGFIGGLKIESLEEVLSYHPERVIKYTVSKMLPKATNLRATLLKRLFVYSEDTHPHAGQSPKLIESIAKV